MWNGAARCTDRMFMREVLLYILKNCETAFNELEKLNNELRSALIPTHDNSDLTRIGNLHRMVQDYLITRVSGLFDNDDRTASFQNLCPNDPEYLKIKKTNNKKLNRA